MADTTPPGQPRRSDPGDRGRSPKPLISNRFAICSAGAPIDADAPPVLHQMKTAWQLMDNSRYPSVLACRASATIYPAKTPDDRLPTYRRPNPTRTSFVQSGPTRRRHGNGSPTNTHLTPNHRPAPAARGSKRPYKPTPPSLWNQHLKRRLREHGFDDVETHSIGLNSSVTVERTADRAAAGVEVIHEAIEFANDQFEVTELAAARRAL